MGEVLGVEFGEALTVVDGLADDKHGSKREVVVVNNLRKVLQLAAIDALIGPRKMIAGCNGRVLRIFLKQLALHVVDDSCRKEDALRSTAILATSGCVFP